MAESARGGRAETPETAAQAARGATNGGSLVSSDHQAVSSQVSSGDPVEVLAGLIEVGLHPPEADCVQCENARRTAARILAAGWRPPLPGVETEWGYRFGHSDVVDRMGSEKAARSEALRAIEMTGSRVTVVRREVGPWTEVQP